MSRIRSSGTTPETRLYAILRTSLGWRRRIDLNVTKLPGQPDVVIPSLRLVLFADGCFYHGCPVHGHNPKSNKRYWVPKLARNRKRDRRTRLELRKQGYEVWRIWECHLRGKRLSRTVKRLNDNLKELLSKHKASGWRS